MKSFYVDSDTRAICDLNAPGLLAPSWSISRINVPREHRGAGIATKLLVEVITEADHEHVDLWLWVSSSDGLNDGQLRQWYTRHGFKILTSTADDPNDGWMVRQWRMPR